MRFLILAHPGDVTATRVAARLLALHPGDESRLLYSNEIATAARWVHSLNNCPARTELTLADGTSIRSDEIGVVFNRLRYVDASHFGMSDQSDREYALMEMFALLLSWLTSVSCPVVSPVSSQNLGGPLHSPIAWQYMAGKAGLPTPRIRMTSSLRRYAVSELDVHPFGPLKIGNVPAWLVEPFAEKHTVAFVAGDRVLGDIPVELHAGCRRLAALSGNKILTINFATKAEDTDWKFNGADPNPQVTGEAAIEAIVQLLEARA